MFARASLHIRITGTNGNTGELIADGNGFLRRPTEFLCARERRRDVNFSRRKKS